MHVSPTHPRSPGRLAFVLVASLALAGCTPSLPDLPDVPGAPAAAAPADAAPVIEGAAGDIVEGSGYTFIGPAGWTVRTGASAQPIDAVVMNMRDTDGFADNINVLITPGTVEPGEMEAVAAKQLKSAGFKNVTVRGRTVVAGSVTTHVSATAEVNDKAYLIEQFYVGDGGKVYVVTFSFSTTVSATDRGELTGSVLKTWGWA